MLKASAPLREKMIRIAAHLLEASPHDVEIKDGRASVRGAPQKTITVRQIAETAYSMTAARLPAGEEFGLESAAHYDPPPMTFANAAHVVQVAVDARTGRIEFEKYAVVHDCGRVVNPMIVEGRYPEGTGRDSARRTWSEVYDDGGTAPVREPRGLSPATTADMPRIAIDHMESTSPTPSRFKGVGRRRHRVDPGHSSAVADALAGLEANVNHSASHDACASSSSARPRAPDRLTFGH